MDEASAPVGLLTVGHGTLQGDELTRLLSSAGVDALVDVRSFPGSRRHPQFGREALGHSLPAAGVSYRWEPRLGGFRRPTPDSPNVALRNPSFRGYADYMSTPEFDDALSDVLSLCRVRRTVIMCSETLWWRCHRRLVSDGAVLVHDTAVHHLGHDGRLSDHRLTDGVRRVGDRLVYDAGRPQLGQE